MNFLMAEEINRFFDNWLVGNPSYSYKYVDDAFHTALSSAEQAEYNKVINFHTKQTHVVDNVKSFLTPTAYKKEQGITDDHCEECSVTPAGFIPTPEKESLPYRVVSYQSSIYIVVEEGFLEQMEDKTSKLKFISDVLKAAYAVMPINMVNQSQWYDIYLDALRVVSS